MKKVELSLERCWGTCSYYNYEKNACGFFTPAKKFNTIDPPYSFPEWCPLEDVIDPVDNP